LLGTAGGKHAARDFPRAIQPEPAIRMLRSAVVLAVAMGLTAPSAWAADYKCAKKETNVALNDHDIGITEREASIKEMKTEISDSGGSTDDQTKVLKLLEDKLAKMKESRERLVKECSGEAAP
jgi:hypothetical protein